MNTSSLRGSAHPYYASEGCYYARPGQDYPHYEHTSWDDFLAEMGDADLDMNLLYRWDWQVPNPADADLYEDGEVPTQEHLALFYMQQRKARPVSHLVAVEPEDEARIAPWLKVHADHMRLLWAPFLAEETSA